MSGKLVNSVVRSLNILETLAHVEDGLGITELSKRIGLAKSTTHRLLMTLFHKGYVVKDEKTEEYRLGIRTLLLYSSFLENLSVRQVARQFMEQLADQVRETVHLVIRDDHEVVYIDKVESVKSTIRMASQVGRRSYMHSTAVGKVFLANLDWKEVEYIIQKAGMPRFTERTITDPDVLKNHLQEIKKNGWAIDNIENEEGIRCVAAPIRDHSGNVVAAISASGPVFNVTDDEVHRILKPSVTETSRLISLELGFDESRYNIKKYVDTLVN